MHLSVMWPGLPQLPLLIPKPILGEWLPDGKLLYLLCLSCCKPSTNSLPSCTRTQWGQVGHSWHVFSQLQSSDLHPLLRIGFVEHAFALHGCFAYSLSDGTSPHWSHILMTHSMWPGRGYLSKNSRTVEEDLILCICMYLLFFCRT